MKTARTLFAAFRAWALLVLAGCEQEKPAPIELRATTTASAVTLQEDFNTSTLTGWNRYSGAFGSSANACFNPNNIKVKNGRLKLLY